MTERWWDEEDESPPPNSKELVEEALNNAEAERIEREEEIAEAKHQLELARMEAEKKRLEGSVSSSQHSAEQSSMGQKRGSEPPIVSARSGFLGLWWLTRGEAIFVICATVFAAVISGIWTIGLMNEATYVEVSATIVSEEDSFWVEGEAEITGNGTVGTGWFMDDLSGWYEDCWTDEEGYEYCDSYYVVEYECYADLYLTWNVSGTEYNGWAYTPSIVTAYGCLEIMERQYQIGDSVPIYYANSEPSQFQAFTIRLGNPDASTYWTETMFHYTDGPNLMTDYECEAILTVTYLDPSDNSSQITTVVLDDRNNGPATFFALSGEPCIVEIMNEYSDGKKVLVLVDETDTSKAYQPGNTPEGFFFITWFCCLGLMALLVIFSFVWIRFSNTPPGSYVTRNGVVHHGGYDGNDVTIINNHYGNRWGYSEGPGVHYRKPTRIGSRRRNRISTGGGRSSGGHSSRGRSGGGGSSGGGSRSSGGGRSGGGRSGGGRSGGGRRR